MYYNSISMRKDKDLIFKLRQNGKSYRQIQKETGVSRATLTAWFKGIEWSKHIEIRNTSQQSEESKERMVRMNMVRKLSLQYKYASIEDEALKQYDLFKLEPLFWAGLMLYEGEGDKRAKHLIRLSNAEFYSHRIFILFAKKYLGAFSGDFRHYILIYQGDNEKTIKDRWVEEMESDSIFFHKTQVIKGKVRQLVEKKKLQFGIGNTIICSTSLKKKLMKWISLAENEEFLRS